MKHSLLGQLQLSREEHEAVGSLAVVAILSAERICRPDNAPYVARNPKNQDLTPIMTPNT